MAFTPKGIVVPIVTPVDEKGQLNEKAYRKLVDYLADNGIHGVFPFGTTGEFYAYDLGFYTHLLEVTKDAVHGRMQIYAGANHITTKGAAEIAKAVEKVGGIDALVSVEIGCRCLFFRELCLAQEMLHQKHGIRETHAAVAVQIAGEDRRRDLRRKILVDGLIHGLRPELAHGLVAVRARVDTV